MRNTREAYVKGWNTQRKNNAQKFGVMIQKNGQRDKTCGIYMMCCERAGHVYIGSTHNFIMRCKLHLNSLKVVIRGTPMLKQYAYKAHFIEAFKNNTLAFFLLEKLPDNITKSDLLVREQVWLDRFPESVNIYKHVTGKGKKLSEDHCKKIRDTHVRMGGNKSFLGHTHTPEWREMMRIKLTGRVFSQETIQKMRAAKLGKVASAATRLKISIAGRRPCSEQTKDKIRQKKIERDRLKREQQNAC